LVLLDGSTSNTSRIAANRGTAIERCVSEFVRIVIEWEPKDGCAIQND
jgi:hypothetical protein